MTEQPCLIDTSAWVEFLRPEGHESITRRVDELVTLQRASTTEIVVLELLLGTKTEADFANVRRRFSGLRLLSAQPDCWEQAARLGFMLRRQGLTVPIADLLIAGVALRNDAILVHADEHFDRIAERAGLRVESFCRV